MERISPIVALSLLEAVRRYEPTLYRDFSRAENVTVESLRRAGKGKRLLGSAIIQRILKTVLRSNNMNDILYLAGMNAYEAFSKELTDRLGYRPGDISSLKVTDALKTLVSASADLFGEAIPEVTRFGKMLRLEVRNSLFARSVSSDKALCAFYSGYIANGISSLIGKPASVIESRCRAVEGEGNLCRFEIAISNH